MTYSRLPFNVSPKLAYALLTRLTVFAVAALGVQLDPVLSAAIAEVVANVVGYRADPGDVISPQPEGSDARLDAGVAALLNGKDAA